MFFFYLAFCLDWSLMFEKAFVVESESLAKISEMVAIDLESVVLSRIWIHAES